MLPLNRHEEARASRIRPQRGVNNFVFCQTVLRKRGAQGQLKTIQTLRIFAYLALCSYLTNPIRLPQATLQSSSATCPSGLGRIKQVPAAIARLAGFQIQVVGNTVTRSCKHVEEKQQGPVVPSRAGAEI